MKIKILWLSVMLILVSYSGSNACSSFMLKTSSEHIYGHNLDIGGNMPGMIFINKRGVQKIGYTWKQLTSAEMNERSNISWISKFGSVTFNAFGRELPDGGMNEEGLFIWEMTGGTTFDTVPHRPRLFMSQWMQYQLDNFKSVQEVLDNLAAIGLDGWNWQFFVADSHGESAGIEFMEGVAVVHTGTNMPIPLMGNGRYSDDLSFLREFEGFGGGIEVDLSDQSLPGMVKAAKMMNDFKGIEKIEDYGFKILEQLSGKTSKWAVIFDLKRMMVYFRTAQYPTTKSISVNSVDFSANTQVKILDIQNPDLSGDVSDKLINFNEQDNYTLVEELVAKVYDDDIEIPQDMLIKRLSSVYKTGELDNTGDIAGNWTGYAEYPTSGDPAKVEWTINIDEKDGEFYGKITDSAGLLVETELKNCTFERGIFRFTVYSYGYVFKIYASVSNRRIEGIFDISDESRKGNFLVQLN